MRSCIALKILISHHNNPLNMKQLYIIGAALCISFGIQAQSTRTVLLEVSESAWTENNSSIICAKEDVKSQFGDDELAVISYHWDDLQNGGDPMYKNFSNEWAQTFNVSVWGRGAIDRTSYNGLTMTSLAEDVWADTVSARINRTTDGLVTLPEVLYDPDEDEIFVRVNIEFTDSVLGIVNREMRFFCYLVQDGVVADQVVDVANLGTCTLFPPPYGLDTVNSVQVITKQNYVHNDVAVSNPSGVGGTDNVISQQVEIGNKFSKNYTFSKPSGISMSSLRVVAFVANYDNGDIEKNEVINAAQTETFVEYDSSDETDPNHPNNIDNPNSQLHPDNWPTAVREIKSFDPEISISPNPTSDLGIIEFNVPQRERIAVSIYDMSGKLVLPVYNQMLAPGGHKAAFSGRNLENGVYVVRVSSASFVGHKTLVIAK